MPQPAPHVAAFNIVVAGGGSGDALAAPRVPCARDVSRGVGACERNAAHNPAGHGQRNNRCGGACVASTRSHFVHATSFLCAVRPPSLPPLPLPGPLSLKASKRSGGKGTTRAGRTPTSPEFSARRRPNRIAEQVKRDVSEIIRSWTTTSSSSSPRAARGRAARGKRGTASATAADDVNSAADSALSSLISVVDVDVSADLRNATVHVSTLIRGGDGASGKEASAVAPEQRPLDAAAAVQWLVERRKPLRHQLAKRMRNQKVVPELHFCESGMSEALRTVSLIEELSAQRSGATDTVRDDDDDGRDGDDGWYKDDDVVDDDDLELDIASDAVNDDNVFL